MSDDLDDNERTVLYVIDRLGGTLEGVEGFAETVDYLDHVRLSDDELCDALDRLTERGVLVRLGGAWWRADKL